MKRRPLLFLILFIITSAAHGQYLRFDEVLQVQAMDSTALKQLCAQKQYDLVKVTENNYVFSYNFRCHDRKSVSFTKAFPKDPSADTYVFYYLSSGREFRKLKDAAKAAGFTLSDKYAMPARYPDMQGKKELYTKDGLELEFGISNVGPGRYVIILSRQAHS